MFEKVVDNRKSVRYNTNIEHMFRTRVYLSVKGEPIMKRDYYNDYDYRNRVAESRIIAKKRARTLQLRRRKFLLFIGIIITIALCTIFSVRTFAGTEDCKEGECGMKQYKSVMIYCGDTVESIAEANFSFPFSSSEKLADEIRSINHIGLNEALIAGNYIIIPYYSL